MSEGFKPPSRCHGQKIAHFPVTDQGRSGVSPLFVDQCPTGFSYPRCSMYGIFTYIYPINDQNVGKHTIHGASGYGFPTSFCHHTTVGDEEAAQRREIEQHAGIRAPQPSFRRESVVGLKRLRIFRLICGLIYWLVVWNIFSIYIYILGITIPVDHFFEGLKPPTSIESIGD